MTDRRKPARSPYRARARRAPAPVLGSWPGREPGPARYPTRVVVDTQDGYTFAKGSDGELFDQATAEAFASARDAEMKPEYRTYQVFALVRPPRPSTPSGTATSTTADPHRLEGKHPTMTTPPPPPATRCSTASPATSCPSVPLVKNPPNWKLPINAVVPVARTVRSSAQR